MKELSVEQKAKAYDEAIRKAKDMLNYKEVRQEDVEYLFPELKESEDKIRKELIDFVKSRLAGFPQCEKFIAWLEKQGEQKSAYKVKPKFKVGDWCIDNEDGIIFQIVKVLDNTYTYKTNEGKEYSCTHYSLENDVRLWTIQDAKDGDVLHPPSHRLIWIYKDNEHYHACINMNYVTENTARNGQIVIPNDVCPATKDEQTILFTKLKETGYEWDADKKELKKIEQKTTKKIEPTFHKGDWVVVSTTKGDRVVQIASVEHFKDGYPSYITTEGRWFGNGTKARLLTDKDVETITIPESKIVVNKAKYWSEEDETYRQRRFNSGDREKA